MGQAVGGGCQSGWGRLLSVTNAIEAGICRQGDSSWAEARRPGRGRVPTHFQCIPAQVVGWDEGQVGLLQPECAQEFRSREDLIECILASCNLPFWFDRWPLLRTERGLCTDGFFSTPVTQFGCIATGARRDVAICPFPASTVSPRLETFEGDNDLIQPGRFPNEHADQFTMQQMVTIALAQPPASDATLRALFRAGEADARAWHEREMDRR